MDAIEAYEKYKHMDETISSPYFRGNNNIPALLQDLWSAVKAAYRPSAGVVESKIVACAVEADKERMLAPGKWVRFKELMHEQELNLPSNGVKGVEK